MIARGTFEWVLRKNVPNNAKILRKRFVLVIKRPGTSSEIFKARLVVQGHLDPLKGVILTEAPTLKNVSVRVIIATALAHDWTLFSRDVSQAFLRSKNSLRDVYVELPASVRRLLDCGNDKILKLIKPQYGIKDGPVYWWHSNNRYHVDVLECASTALDPCLFVHFDGSSRLSGIVGTQVDDFLGAGNDAFLEKEELLSAQTLDVKPRILRTFDFAGSNIY